MPLPLCRCLLILFLMAGLSCQRSTEIRSWSVELNPEGSTPLAARAHLLTSEPVQIVGVHIEPGVTSAIPDSEFRTEHELPIIGFQPDTEASVRLSYRRQGSSTEFTPPRRITTAALPDFIPEIQVRQESVGEGGYLLLGLVPLALGTPLTQKGMILLLDQNGEVVWYRWLQRSPTEIRRTDRGTLLLQTLDGLDSIEMTWLGEVVRHFQSTGLREPESDQIQVDLDTLHHDFSETQDGQWTLSSKRVGDFIDETVVYLDSEGQVEREISLMKLLDPKRELYPKFPNFWEMFYGKGVIDWGHSNSLFLDATGKTALVSLRHQDAVVKLDLEQERILWILGRPDKWEPKHQELLLRPKGDLTWFAKQHAAKWTKSGTVLLFDNGREQSRAVEFAVDEETKTVEQVWQFTGAEPFFSEYLCDVDELPQSGNIQITDGARKADDGEFFARVLEVTHRTPPEVVWEIEFHRPETTGCTVYRSERYGKLY